LGSLSLSIPMLKISFIRIAIIISFQSIAMFYAISSVSNISASRFSY
jgi:hypothetical protein